MLKLLIFLPCEKVILAKQGQASLIGVLELIQVNVAKDLPLDALIPFRWSVLTLWIREEEVAEPIKYEQDIQLIRPDGTNALKATANFQVTNDHEHFRQVADIPAFPVGVEGRYTCKLFLRKAETEEEWKEMGWFPIHVKHLNNEDNAEQVSQP
jgi:hypothetical protein